MASLYKDSVKDVLKIKHVQFSGHSCDDILQGHAARTLRKKRIALRL